MSGLKTLIVLFNSIHISPFSSILIHQNPLSPTNLEAALLYRDNRTEYDRCVLQIIQDTNDDDDNGRIEDSDTLRQKMTVLRHSISE